LAGGFVFCFYVLLRIRRRQAARLILFTLGFFTLLGIAGFILVTEFQHVAGVNIIAHGFNKLAVNFIQAQSGNAFNDLSSRGRLILYQDAIDLIKTAPIFGHGVGAFGYLGDYLVLGTYPHNMFLEILLDGGIVGLLLFLGFLVPVGLYALRRAWPINAEWQPIFLAGLFLETLVRHQVSMTITTGKVLFFTVGILIAQWASEMRAKRGLDQQRGTLSAQA
jgi:O-antigen ligase